MLIALLQMILTLALVGLVVWVVITYIPMPEIFKVVIGVVVALVVILWLLNVLTVGSLPMRGWKWCP